MELIRNWSEDGFELFLYDLHETDSLGKSILGYTFHDAKFPSTEQMIFAGLDYHLSPLHSVDSEDAINGLLSFFTIAEGDTDKEYFDNYTPNMINWRDSQRREDLESILFA